MGEREAEDVGSSCIIIRSPASRNCSQECGMRCSAYIWGWGAGNDDSDVSRGVARALIISRYRGRDGVVRIFATEL